eukprot:gene9398-biopygen7055
MTSAAQSPISPVPRFRRDWTDHRQGLKESILSSGFVAPRPERGSITLVTPPYGWRVRVTAVDLVLPSAQVQSPRVPSSLKFMKVPSVGQWPIPLEERPPLSGPSCIETAAVFGAHADVPRECPPLQAPFGCPGLGLPRLLGSGAT